MKNQPKNTHRIVSRRRLGQRRVNQGHFLAVSNRNSVQEHRLTIGSDAHVLGIAIGPGSKNLVSDACSTATHSDGLG
jgi:hypothetical protein